MIIRYGVAALCLISSLLLPFDKAVAQNDADAIKCICLDAGHGGKDPGAVGAKTYEKHIVLSVVLKLGKMIEQHYPNLKVIYVRRKDVYLELAERTKLANTNKADLFISVHANAVDSKKVAGVETYVLGSNSSDHNLRVAMKENSVIHYEDDYSVKYADFDPSRAESYIIFNMIRNMHLDKSLTVAAMIQKELVKNTQHADREVRQAPLWVLKDAAMPATLVEIGYISNLAEERYMMSAEGQDKIVKSIFRGFESYKNKIEKNTKTPKDEPVEIAEKEDETPPAEDKSPKDIEKEETKTLVKPQQQEIQPTNPGATPFYAVQIASASDKIKNTSRLCPGEEIYELYSGGRYRYYVVQSQDFEEVKKNLQKIKNKVPDCFVIAVHKGDILPIAQARKLELK